MNMPGFTAEASFYQTHEHYHIVGDGSSSELHAVHPAFGCGPCTCRRICSTRSPYPCWFFCSQLCWVPPAHIIQMPCLPP
jgi:hypothetical protein